MPNVFLMSVKGLTLVRMQLKVMVFKINQIPLVNIAYDLVELS
jgi:hypothetical protein